VRRRDRHGQIEAGVRALNLSAQQRRGQPTDQHDLQEMMQNLRRHCAREDEMLRARRSRSTGAARAAIAVAGNIEYNPGWHTLPI
jgi:hypothetical protein